MEEPSKAPQAPPHTGPGGSRPLPDHDLATALVRMDNDQSLLNEVIDIFLEDYVESLKALKTAASKGDTVSLQRAAHTLKGAVSNFVAVQATQTAYSVELACKEGRIQDALAKVDDLETTVISLAGALREFRLKEAA